MRHCILLAIISFLSLLGLGIFAQDIDADDVPSQCQDICGPLVNSTATCDDSTEGDSAYLDCVCGANDASSIVPQCAACIAQNGGDSDNDAYDLVSKCSFTTTSYTGAGAASGSMTYASGASMTSGSMSAAMTSAASGSSAGGITSGASGTSAPAASAASSGASAQTSGAATEEFTASSRAALLSAVLGLVMFA